MCNIIILYGNIYYNNISNEDGKRRNGTQQIEKTEIYINKIFFDIILVLNDIYA